MADTTAPATRVEWTDRDQNGIRFVIAEHTAEGWQFWERDNYEVRWHVLKSTADLVNKATNLNEKAK
jgi:hypothetical protein